VTKMGYIWLVDVTFGSKKLIYFNVFVMIMNEVFYFISLMFLSAFLILHHFQSQIRPHGK
jgi:hypothetical protein